MKKRFLGLLFTLNVLMNITAQTNSVFDIEGNTYSTVIIGNQEWMAENLRTSKFNDGSSISNTLSFSDWSILTSPSWCYYNNDASLNGTYGKLYNGYVIEDNRNVCPVGWRVPSKADWDTLFYNLGGQDSIADISGFQVYVGQKYVGGMMKSIGTLQASDGLWQSPNTNASNSSGFNALPSGQRSYWDDFLGGNGYSAHFWSSTQVPPAENFVVSLGHSTDLAISSSDISEVGNSIRCVRDIFIQQGFFQWNIQQAPNETYGLYSVSFSSETHGCAVGGNIGYDKILTTTDGGLNWNAQTAGAGFPLIDIQLVSSSEGYAVGWGGTILKTTNGGLNWLPLNSGTSINLHSVYFKTPLIGWVVGSNGVILHTNNGGQSWSPQTSPITVNLWGVHFISTSEGYIVGENTILKTTNGGGNWVMTTVPYPLKSVFFTSPTNGYAVGNNYINPSAPGEGVVYTTNDAGASWSPQIWPEGLNDVHFQTIDEGWVVGTNGSVYKTNNGGLIWQTEISNLISNIRGVSFVSPTKGWAVSMGGGIISTTNGMVGVTNFEPNQIVYEIIPNPTTDNATIKFQVNHPGIVAFELIDGYGRIVKRVLSQNLESGEYNYNFSVIDLENGVYYGRLEIDGKATTRKIIIQKN